MDLFGIGGIAQGVGTAAGAALNYKGAREANKMNMNLANQQMDFQRGENTTAFERSQGSAREQMAFQERMSNTSYQRAMADMQASGLNPILAFQQGGASTPSGSSASGVSSSGSRAEVRNQYSGAVSTALQAMQISSQIEQSRALTNLMKAELPEKQATAGVYGSSMGKVLKWVERILSPLRDASSAVSKYLR